MRRTLLVGLWLCATGCKDWSAQGTQAEVDEAYFECMVQPVLTKSCAMFLCHGDGRRPMRIFARNRLRYGGTEDDRNVPLRPEELHMNFLAARAMIDVNDVEKSAWLLKPLDEKAGGAYHGGAEEYGMGDVFLAEDEPDYLRLRDFAHGVRCVDDEACAARCPQATDAGTATDAAGGAP